MAQYVDRTLANGEYIVQRGRWPLAFWIVAYLWLIFLGFLIVGIIAYLSMITKMITTEFAVTNQRVVLKWGLIRRSTQELSIDTIEGVSVRQSIWGRFLGYGQVLVTGTGDALIAFPPMADPLGFRRAIENGRTAEQGMRLTDEDVRKLAAAQAAAQRAASNQTRFIGALGKRQP